MNELFYPTVDLFIYDLKSPLNADLVEIDRNKRAFLARLPSDIKIQDYEKEEEYLPLAKNPLTNDTIELKATSASLAGYYYPVRLNDTYGLQIDCSVDNFTEPQVIDESFRSIAAEIKIAAQSKILTIGKTYLISGWLSEE